MDYWNKNNRACTTTWITLKVLDQNHKVFVDSGTVKMDELNYWNPGDSPSARDLKANALSIQIDNVLRMIRKAKYEKGVDNDKAIGDTANSLKNSKLTISQLAEIMDNNYLFWREGTDEF